MHRLGDGTKVPDIDAARKEWREAGRTCSTFPSKGEWDAFESDFGELVEKFDDGLEVRQHATIKDVTRGGTRKIVHNCVIYGNPEAHARWAADPRDDKGWYPRWTYDHCRELEEILAFCRAGTRLRPVSVSVIETGIPHELP